MSWRTRQKGFVVLFPETVASDCLRGWNSDKKFVNILIPSVKECSLVLDVNIY